jgi:hypothetical protein
MPWCGRNLLKYATYSRRTRYELARAENEQVVQAFPARPAEEPLAHSMRPRCLRWRAEDLDAADLRDARERRPILAVVVVAEVLRYALTGVLW